MNRHTNDDFVSDRQMLIIGATQAIVIAALHTGGSEAVPAVVDLLDKVHAKITALVDGVAPAAVEPVADLPTPAQIRKSITPDALISFIDGKAYKTLKRHLTKHGLDVAGYRARYGLPADYPSTAANYSAQRSALAKATGLGQPGRMAPAVELPAKRVPKAKAALAA